MPPFLKVRLFIAARISARPKARINPRVNVLWPYMLENKMKKIMLAVTALLLTAGCSAVQAEPIHADVKASQDNAEDCEHFAGEWDSSLPESRQKEIEAGIDKYCTAARQQQAQLRKKYPGNKQIANKTPPRRGLRGLLRVYCSENCHEPIGLRTSTIIFSSPSITT